jgi:hypothetical protein
MFVRLVVTKVNMCGYELWKLKKRYDMKKRNYKEQWAFIVPWPHYDNTNVAAIPPVQDYLDQMAIFEEDRDLLQNLYNDF